MNSPIRGIRNNNPFNIKLNKDNNWLGKVVSSDPVFEQFDLIEHGVRAGLKLLSNYLKQGYDTPRKIVNRFAPRSENNVNGYLHYVCNGSLRLDPDSRINTLRKFLSLAVRIVQFECNLNYNQLFGYGCDYQTMRSIFYRYNLTLK